MGAVFHAKDGLEGDHVQGPPAPRDEPLVDLLQHRALHKQAAGVHPPLTGPDDASEGVRVAQGLREPIQGPEVGPTDEAVLRLPGRDSLLAGTPFDPFVAVEQDLHAKRRMAAQLEAKVAPVFVEDVKVVVVDMRLGGLAPEVGATLRALGHLPDERRGLRHQD